MENDDGDTVPNITFDTGSSQHHPQMPVHTYQQYLPHHIDH